MQQLKDIFIGIELRQVMGSLQSSVQEIVFDSRQAKEHTIFVAIAGTTSDGHDYIPQVVQQGCKHIVCEHVSSVVEGITYVVVNNTHQALGKMASNFFGNPSEQLTLVGITGTNGKTTTATLLYDLFSKLGYKVGLLSTVVNKIGTNAIPSTHTTPNPVALNQLLRKMVDEGCTHCFMEVSSHAIHQHRIAGLQFEGGVFTNITHDHLDYHKTFQEYIKAKKAFFDGLPQTAFALSNYDDKNGKIMLQNTSARKVGYALKSVADYSLRILESQFTGQLLYIENQEVWVNLIGTFNAYNLLVIYAVSTLLGEDKQAVLTAMSQLESVEGRFQYQISASGIMAIVDYAHTPDALENVLKTINDIRTHNEILTSVVGCGGDRDKTKRPEMAKIACSSSDKVIFTSDNPRSEEPQAILGDMMAGVEGHNYRKTAVIVDRKEAIKMAVSQANKGDILLIAGKGHEKYQEIKGVKYDFDDKAIVSEMFNLFEK